MATAFQIRHSVRLLKQGGVIAYPTEAVYGLGCDPRNEAAVLKILHMKQRSWRKGLILIAAHIGQLESYIAPLSEQQQTRLEQSWPGPVTWLVPISNHCPKLIRGKHSMVAVRVSAHSLSKSLCQAFQAPIVSTSANIASHSPCNNALQVQKIFGKHIDYCIPGKLGGRQHASEIRNLLTGEIIRPG